MNVMELYYDTIEVSFDTIYKLQKVEKFLLVSNTQQRLLCVATKTVGCRLLNVAITTSGGSLRFHSVMSQLR